MDEHGYVEDGDVLISRDTLERARLLSRLLRIPDAQAIGFAFLIREAADISPGIQFTPQEISALASWNGPADTLQAAAIKVGLFHQRSPPAMQPPQTRDPEPRVRPTSWVYFIRAGDDGPIKIGYSKAPDQRLSSLQTGHPSRLRLLATEPGDAVKEAALHQRFAATRKEGEWFEATPELLGYIATLSAQAN